MTSMGRLELLLMRVHDGVATPDEREEFEALGGADAARAWDSMRAQLVGAVAGAVDLADEVLASVEPPPWGQSLRDAVVAPVDVTDDVMALLEEPTWAADLRGALAPPVDLADAVMAGIEELGSLERMCYGDGEVDAARLPEVSGRLLRDPLAREALAAQAELCAAVRGAVTGEVDVWAAVAGAIGADAGEPEVPGWDQTAAALRAAVRAAPVDVAPAVMAEIAPPVRRALPLWASLGVPVGVFAAAAAAVLAVLSAGPVTQPDLTADVRHTVGLDLTLATVNDARVEEIETEGDVVAQVVQFEDEGPTFIILDDPDGVHDAASPGAPL